MRGLVRALIQVFAAGVIVGAVVQLVKDWLREPELEHDDVEALSAVLHGVYQAEARRQARTGEDTVRHPDDYHSLPEHTKEYDRVLARFILARDAARAVEAQRREAWAF